ncbi:MAG: hypothetical protein ACRCW2_01765 [Cellulosilyticaceae bacterium]
MSYERTEYKGCHRATTLNLDNAIDVMIDQGHIREIRTDIWAQDYGEDSGCQALRIWGQVIGKGGYMISYKALKLVKVICKGGVIDYQEIARTWSDCDGQYVFNIEAQCDAAYYKVMIEDCRAHEYWIDREDEIRPCPQQHTLQNREIGDVQKHSNKRCYRAEGITRENGMDIIMKKGNVDEVRTDIIVDTSQKNKKCRRLRIWGQILGTDGLVVPDRLVKLFEVVWKCAEVVYEEIGYTRSDCEGWYEFCFETECDVAYYKVIAEEIED